MNDFDNRKVEDKKLADILDVVHKLTQGTKKLEITKTYKHDSPSVDRHIVTEEKTTYRIVDTL